MKPLINLGIWLLSGLFFLTGVSWAALPQLGQIKCGNYSLKAVSNHIPWGYRSAQKYWDSMQRIELEVGNTERFKDLPKLGMKNPYTGYIVLGDQDQKFGFIVDIYGEEKRLYIDRDGDGSFAGESYSLLLNEWYGGYSWLSSHAYWVLGPEPVRLSVPYQKAGGTVVQPIEISVLGYIFKPGFLGKEKPFLLVEVRTWFLAEIIEDGMGKLVGLVDQNHNGRYNDYQDLLFVDYNNNGFFENNEAIRRKNGVKLKKGRKKVSFDWGAYPEQLQVEEEKR